MNQTTRDDLRVQINRALRQTYRVYAMGDNMPDEMPPEMLRAMTNKVVSSVDPFLAATAPTGSDGDTCEEPRCALEHNPRETPCSLGRVTEAGEG